jgi:hypothetical protein
MMMTESGPLLNEWFNTMTSGMIVKTIEKIKPMVYAFNDP